MKYLCLICAEQMMEHLHSDDAAQHYRDYAAFTEGIKAGGQFLSANRLLPPETATTVRVRDGRVLVTDGPFAETKEMLGGYYLIEARDLREAIEIASKIPGASRGCVELRAVADDLQTRALGFDVPAQPQLTCTPGHTMTAHAKNTCATLIPCLRYRDALAAIDWLCAAFGFERHAVYANEDGTIAHAQMNFGNGMVMLGSVREHDDAWGRWIRQPDEVGGVETQSAYVVVSDADALYAQAKAAGARIVVEIRDEDYGGRGFSCHDLEGHLSSFGTYDPWPCPI